MQADEAVGLFILFVAFPFLFVWSGRDRIEARHVAILFVLALLCGLVAGGAFLSVGGTTAGWARLAPGLVLLGAGAIGILLLSSAIMALAALVLRDERNVAFRRELDRYSGEPRRPSMAPYSGREWHTRFLLALFVGAAFWSIVTVHMIVSGSAVNYLRVVGLYRGPDDPRTLSFAHTPEPYMLQVLLFGLIAVAFLVASVVVYVRGPRRT